MIEWQNLNDAHPALAQSPMVRGVEKIFDWMGAHGSIPLTPSKAFKRVFVYWAAAEFDWPGHKEANLFAVNRVLNESDFMPLIVLHDLMIGMKLGQHYKGVFRLTKAGKALMGHPGLIFGAVVPFFLFRVDRANFSRMRDAPVLGNWDNFMNVLNVEAEDGATGAHLRRVLYGEPKQKPWPRYDAVMGTFYIQVLRPLCWAGLLHQQRGADSYRTEDALFVKTPLWKAALRLDTDGEVRGATRH